MTLEIFRHTLGPWTTWHAIAGVREYGSTRYATAAFRSRPPVNLAGPGWPAIAYARERGAPAQRPGCDKRQAPPRRRLAVRRRKDRYRSGPAVIKPPYDTPVSAAAPSS